MLYDTVIQLPPGGPGASPPNFGVNPSRGIVRHTHTQRPEASRGVPGTLWGSLGHPSGFLGPPGVIKACHNSLVWPRPLC